MKKIQTGSKTGGLHLWLILWKAHDAVRQYATQNIASLSPGLSDFAILEALLHKGPMPVNDIGARVMLTSGSMTTAIDRLEARGLVERRVQPEDRRTRMVFLTPDGEKLISCAFAEHSRAMESLGQTLSPAERASAIRILKKLGREAERRVQS
jgi:MarR family 2-MHQ and catechol resistance regulon transcriptional repressor